MRGQTKEGIQHYEVREKDWTKGEIILKTWNTKALNLIFLLTNHPIQIQPTYWADIIGGTTASTTSKRPSSKERIKFFKTNVFRSTLKREKFSIS